MFLIQVKELYGDVNEKNSTNFYNICIIFKILQRSNYLNTTSVKVVVINVHVFKIDIYQ